MKRFVLALTVLALVLIALAPTTNAQSTSPKGTYTVQSGDTLYELSNIYLNNANMWRQVLEANPFLKEPGRVFEKEGKIIVLIRPGEKLAGLEELGIYPYVLPFAELKLPETATPPATPTATSEETGVSWLKLLGIIFLGLLALGAIMTIIDSIRKHREMGLDPVTSGQPIVAGGVQPNEHERLERTMQTAAVSEYVRMNPGIERHTVHVERIGPIEEGTISGEGMVGYADRARPRRIDPPQPGYRSRFRFPDGREDNLMSLQGCMNPCYYGEGLSGFTFVPRQQVLPTPEPERPAPQPVPHPAMALRRIREDATEESRSTLTIGDRVIVIDRGAHLSVDEATGTVNITGTSFEMQVKPKRVRAKSARTTQTATGTDNGE